MKIGVIELISLEKYQILMKIDVKVVSISSMNHTEIIGKIKKIYIESIKISVIGERGMGGSWGSCYNYCNCSNHRHVVPIKCFRDRVGRFIVNVLTIH